MSLILHPDIPQVFLTDCGVHCDHHVCCDFEFEFVNTNIVDNPTNCVFSLESNTGKSLAGTVVKTGIVDPDSPDPFVLCPVLVDTACGEVLGYEDDIPGLSQMPFVLLETDEQLIDYQHPWCVTACYTSDISTAVNLYSGVSNGGGGSAIGFGGPVINWPGLLQGEKPADRDMVNVECRHIAKSVCRNRVGAMASNQVSDRIFPWVFFFKSIENTCCLTTQISADPCGTRACCSTALKEGFKIDPDLKVAIESILVTQNDVDFGGLPFEWPDELFDVADDSCFLIWINPHAAVGDQMFHVVGSVTSEYNGQDVSIDDDKLFSQIFEDVVLTPSGNTMFPGMIQCWDEGQRITVNALHALSLEYEKEYHCDLLPVAVNAGPCENCIVDGIDTTPAVVKMIVQGVQRPECGPNASPLPGCTVNDCDDECTEVLMEIFEQTAFQQGLTLSRDGCSWGGSFQTGDYPSTLEANCGIFLNFSITPTHYIVTIEFRSDGNPSCFDTWRKVRFDGDPCATNNTADGLPAGSNWVRDLPLGPLGCCWIDVTGVTFDMEVTPI